MMWQYWFSLIADCMVSGVWRCCAWLFVSLWVHFQPLWQW